MAAIAGDDLGAALAGLSALSTASSGLLDASKAFGGGVSNIGFKYLEEKLQPFEPALKAAVGDDWLEVVRSNWIAGMPRVQQTATMQSLVRLGLRTKTAPDIAKRCDVKEAELLSAASKFATGKRLTAEEVAVLKRVNDYVDALLNAAYERADEKYRNACRLLAGLIAVALAIVGRQLLWSTGHRPGFWVAVAVGILAVPLSPVAKDLSSSLSTAVKAFKAAQSL